MSWWLLFIPACFALNAAPGPNNLTAFVNGARLPLGAALLASLGRLPAFTILIGITAIGLGAALAASSSALWVIKILGAAYLVYIGVAMMRAPAPQALDPDRAGIGPLARQDFLVAIGNPKAIAIFTAFFPQFLDPAGPVAPQILTMGAAFLVLEMIAAALYVLAGRGFGTALGRTGWIAPLQRVVGAFLIVSGVSMLLSGGGGPRAARPEPT